MKTLVIHPKDFSTDFLSVIYKDKDYTILKENLSHKLIKTEIKNHDRIIMLGHGDIYGLLDIRTGMNVIHSKLVYLLREKDIVAIWCNADQFVEKYKLKGFYSGMFISEVEEALDYSYSVSNSEIEKSNNLFAETVSKYIDDDNILEKVKEEYIGDSVIINFNNEKLYKSCI